MRRDRTVGVRLSRLGSWLDATPLAQVVLAVMRDATGRPDPVVALRPDKPAALPVGRRIACWSLVGGVGTSTTAALVAHRSAAAGRAPLLADLDRWAPSLALRARLEAATIADVLVQPGREAALVSRWSAVPFIPGSAGLAGQIDAERAFDALERIASSAPIVIDLGTGIDALDPAITSRLDRLCVVTGPRVSQLQAAFCARPHLRDVPCPAGLVMVGAQESDASLIAERIGLELLAAIPTDPYLANDDFATRAPTLRAVDTLIRALS